MIQLAKTQSSDPDIIIIGGGPGGATAAMLLARQGLRALVLEKESFPRFHIGESLVPRNFTLLKELGLDAAIEHIPHMPKLGAEFVLGGDPNSSRRFGFDEGLLPGSPTINVERSGFDKLLLDAAIAAGAVVRQNTAVEKILRLADGDVAVQVDGQPITAKYLIDASGQGTVIARHLGTRIPRADSAFQKVAYFQNFESVRRRPGIEAGHPCIAMCKEGWFWFINIDPTRTSVGFVAHPDLCKTVGIAPTRLLAWAIEHCPVAKERMREAVGPDTNDIIANFSYNCRPYAGPGHFLVGDAAAFIDPIFSTGVTIAMMGAQEAARQLLDILHGKASPASARKRYIRFVEGSSSVFWRMIRGYYHHSFRELFLNGEGPIQMHKAVISALAGQVFPKPVWALRWRLRAFEVCIWLQKYFALVPHRAEFSLLDSAGGAASQAAQSSVVSAA